MNYGMLGAIDNGGVMTSIGREMVELPLDSPLSKMVVMGSKLECKRTLLLASMSKLLDCIWDELERAQTV
jgi:pre-mRNA-splicing factor ATP-dependent RNA helicase DHX38/PRP16